MGQAVLCILLVAALAATGRESYKVDAENTKSHGRNVFRRDNGERFSCCTPKAWTSRMRLASTYNMKFANQIQETWHTYHYDANNSREAWTDVIQDGKLMSPKTFVDYKARNWTIFMDEKTCVVYKIQGDFKPHCTPGGDNMVEFAVAPALSLKGPPRGVFANTVTYQNNDAMGHVTVTVGTCALVEEASFRASSVDTIKYFNQTLTVDASAFAIPKGVNCPIVHETDGAQHKRHLDLLTRMMTVSRRMPRL